MNATGKGRRGKSANKFGARRTVVDGISFDSKAEAKRWCELRLLERAGEIHGLRRQVDFPLYVLDWLIGTYRADFVYLRAGKRVVEDVKGVKTQLFNRTAKHFAAQYGQEIEVVR